MCEVVRITGEEGFDVVLRVDRQSLAGTPLIVFGPIQVMGSGFPNTDRPSRQDRAFGCVQRSLVSRPLRLTLRRLSASSPGARARTSELSHATGMGSRLSRARKSMRVQFETPSSGSGMSATQSASAYFIWAPPSAMLSTAVVGRMHVRRAAWSSSPRTHGGHDRSVTHVGFPAGHVT